MLLENHNAIEVGGYAISNSLRFQSASTQDLSRTPASAGNRKTWTLSTWVKRGALNSASNYTILGAYGNISNSQGGIRFTTNSIDIYNFNGTSDVYELTSTQVFRDPSAWYHIVVAMDTTQATASNRLKVYINGSQVTAFTVATYPALNADDYVNSAYPQRIGSVYRGTGTIAYFDGYLAEYNFIDGQALTPSSFGETNTLTGQWIAKKYTGTYGTNGFYLPFSNGTSTTTLGADSSGNGNNWTLNNFTRSAGVSDCWMNDVPSGNGGASGTQPSSNYCVLNTLNQYASTSSSYANLRFTSGAAAFQSIASTISVSSGKWYWEIICGTTSANGTVIGISNPSTNYINNNNYIGQAADSYSYYSANGQKINNNAGAAYGATFTTGDVIGVALDLDAGTLTFYKNNTSQGTAYTGLTGTFCPAVSVYDSARYIDANFGQRSFAYTPPTGFKALCTANL